VHLLCPDIDCLGNDLPAGTVADASCRYCGRSLVDGYGNVLAQGAAPLVNGRSPESFDALMEALKSADAEVQVVELTAVRHGDRLLYSAVSDDGDVLSAGVTEGAPAAALERSMDLLHDDE
jgi:hypothetical protein